MDPARKRNVDDSGFPRTPDRLPELFDLHVLLSEVWETMKERHPKDTTIMSYSKPSGRTNRCSRSKTQERSHARMLSQTTLDSELNAEYEESGNSYDYVKLVKAQRTTQSEPEQLGRPEKVVAYLQQIQRAKLIQLFGCLLALDEKSFNIIAFSENAPEMLMAINPTVPTVDDDAPKIQIGTNVQSIFSGPSAAALHKALKFDDVSLLNPIIVQCKTSGKKMYAIVHRSTGCLVVDFEPVKHTEFPSIATGTSQSYKHATKAVSKMQSLPGGSMQILCNTVVKEVFDLTGYDRVMAYKFHEDDHGEVIAEITKPGLEPYLGLHYPATDIPQAARVLFMKSKVRIICDCRANSVKTIEAKGLPFDISLAGSTLRAPHSCHLEYMENMNSIASLVMAVVINENREDNDVKPEEPPKELKSRRLWGLLVCHHESPRYIPFPVRYACEFLAEVFAVHVNNEFLLEKQIREKSILDVQTMLSDMLFHEASPLGIISGTPNIMDLVKCDGAALLHGDKVWRLRMAPTETQIRDIASWLSKVHRDSTGLSTDSLVDAGYPGTASLGDRICGMAMAKIAPNDIVFWFRSHTAADIKWGGAKHDPSDQDDNRRMHPRLSFMAFLEVVKMKSLPWNDYEMDAICSLQLILRDRMNGATKPTGAAGLDNLQIDDIKLDCLDELHMVTSEMVRLAEATSAPILGVDVNGLLNQQNQNNAIKPAMDSCLDSQDGGHMYHKLDGHAELQTVTKEMSRLMETASVPIFAVDANGLVSGWNLKLVELTGLTVQETVGRNILTLVEQSSFQVVQKMLYLALEGKEEKEVRFEVKTHSSRADDGPVILVANACSSRDISGHVIGVCFVAQDMTVHKLAMDKFTRVDGDYKAIIHNPNPLIPPIFGADQFGWCSEWNVAMTKLTGFHRDEVLDKMLVGEVFDSSNGSCLMKDHDSVVRLCVIINSALAGKQTDKATFGFYNRNGKYIECILSAYGKENTDGIVDGVFCFIHVPSQELQHALHMKQASEQTTLRKIKAFSYMRYAINNPLSGLLHTTEALKSTGLNEEQMRHPNVADRCHRQLDKILADIDHDNITDESFCFELEMVEFVLQDVVEGAVSQVLTASQDKDIGVLVNQSEGFMKEKLYGDGIRLQQLLSDILFVSVKFSTVGGSVEICCNLTKNRIGKSLHLELRIKHKGLGVPGEILSETYKDDIKDMSWEGLSLVVSRYLLKLMNGDIGYVRKAGTSTFILTAELSSAPTAIGQ